MRQPLPKVAIDNRLYWHDAAAGVYRSMGFSGVTLRVADVDPARQVVEADPDRPVGAAVRRIRRELQELDIELGGVEHAVSSAMAERDATDGPPRAYTLDSLNDTFVRVMARRRSLLADLRRALQRDRGRSGRDR